MSFDATRTKLYMRSGIAQDKSALVRVDWSTGDETVLFESPCADVTDTIFDMRTFEPEAVAIDPGRQQWTALTPAVAPELALIQARISRDGSVADSDLFRPGFPT